jgi:membrane protein
MLSSRFVRFFCHLNLKVLKQVIRDVGERRLPGLATEMAYNNLFALFPTLIGLLAAVGTLKISKETLDAAALQLSPLVPPEVIQIIEGFIQQTRLPQGKLSIIQISGQILP